MRIGLCYLVLAHAPLAAIAAAINASFPLDNVQPTNDTADSQLNVDPVVQAGSRAYPPTSTAPLTCRWGNCGELCAPGYMPVPRDGGQPGEMMWDHTHCDGKGLQLFCCPKDIPTQPTCRWAGHKNTGDCQSDCKSHEFKVGSLKLGCRTKHQAACCTYSIATQAYGDCRWYGEAPYCASFWLPKYTELGGCSPEFPNLIVKMSAGFGGSRSTFKSFCCKNPTPEPFRNCGWHMKETHLFDDNRCETSCPIDQIKVGMDDMDDSKCKGPAAYCCAGVKRPASLPSATPSTASSSSMTSISTPSATRSPSEVPLKESPSKMQELAAFEEAAKFFGQYAGTETCPTWVWAPAKVPLKSEAAEASSDQGRFVYGNLDPTDRLLCRKYGQEVYSYLTHAMTTDARDELEKAKNATYDRLVALERPELSLSQMLQYSLDHPDERREDQVIEAYDDPKAWKRKVIDRRISRPPCLEFAASTGDIVSPDVSQAGILSWNVTNTNETMRLKPRVIDNNPQESLDCGYECAEVRPTFGDIVEGIRLGRLSVHYARFLWYNAKASSFYPKGPFLEIAYWIGPKPGVSTTEMDRELRLDRYRDPTARRRARWVVFHLHIDSTRPFFSEAPSVFGSGQIGPQTVVHVSAISMYHSSRAIVDTSTGPYWRAENQDTDGFQGGQATTLRAKFRCPNQNNLIAVYPTWASLSPGWAEHQHVAWWLTGLYNDGYLGAAAMKHLFKGPINGFLILRPGFTNQLPLNARLKNPPIPKAKDNPNTDPDFAMRQKYGEKPADDLLKYGYDVNFRFMPRRADGITPGDLEYVTSIDPEWFK